MTDYSFEQTLKRGRESQRQIERETAIGGRLTVKQTQRERQRHRRRTETHRHTETQERHRRRETECIDTQRDREGHAVTDSRGRE